MITNREYLIEALAGRLDDPGAEESEIYYAVACPYRAGDKRAECSGEYVPNRDTCSSCKYDWLDSEVDE